MHYSDMCLMKNLGFFPNNLWVSENSVSVSRNPSFTNIKNSLKSRFLSKKILKKDTLFNNNSNEKVNLQLGKTPICLLRR